MSNPIQYIRNEQIDKIKWDKTVNDSPNGFVYCKSFYLDVMCHWDALVMGDYEFIMPLPNKSKWGIRYIYTPYFTGQLGIISFKKISEEIVLKFLESIPGHFLYIDLLLNEFNVVNGETNKIKTQKRINYILPLDNPYHLIEANYSKDAQKNLKQAAKYQLMAVENIDIEIVVEFFKNAYGTFNSKIGNEVYSRFTRVAKNAIQNDSGFSYGLKDRNGQIVSAAFFGKDNKRIYYICAAPNEQGRNMNAQHVLIDSIIKKYAGSGLVLDFEGSDIPSVANFYLKFSPEQRDYQQIKITSLPIWINWLKK